MLGRGGTILLQIENQKVLLSCSVGYGTVKFPKVLCTLVNKFTSQELIQCKVENYMSLFAVYNVMLLITRYTP